VPLGQIFSVRSRIFPQEKLGVALRKFEQTNFSFIWVWMGIKHICL